jgi:protoporphyrinogen oxidase
MSSQLKWCVIGSGMLGMTLALRLSQNGHKVTLLESSGGAGGLAGPWQMDGVSWDRFYHVILKSDIHTRQIIKEVGLENELRWVETKSGFYSGGKLYSMSNLIEFFRFPPINMVDKLRLGLTIYDASRRNDWKRLEKSMVADWLIKRSGKKVYDRIWYPLLKSKLGDDVSINVTSAAFIWSTIRRMNAARRSGLKKEMFGYVSGGYEKIISRFTSHLEDLGVELKFNSPVTSVKRDGPGTLRLCLQDGSTEVFDRVISTIPSGSSVRIAGGLEDWERQLHMNIRYLGVVCAAVLLKKPVSPYYITNILDKGHPFTGIIEMTGLIDRSEVKGLNLVYLPKYLDPNDPLFDATDANLKEVFLGGLLKMHSHISMDDVAFFGVSKARYVFALPTINYSNSLPDIKTSLENYYIINSAQIVNGTLNVNETIRMAENKLKEIIGI